MKLNIKTGDTVQVITGADKGKQGRVISLNRKTMRVLIEGVNVRTKHSRPSNALPNGGIIKKEMPIHYSNVLLLDDNGKPTRKSPARD